MSGNRREMSGNRREMSGNVRTRTRTTFQLSGFFPIERFWMKWALFLLETGKSRKKCPRKTQVYIYIYTRDYAGHVPEGFLESFLLKLQPAPHVSNPASGNQCAVRWNLACLPNSQYFVPVVSLHGLAPFVNRLSPFRVWVWPTQWKGTL